MAARHGGSADPEKNVALSNVIKKARAGGVPKANIESALQKAAGGKEGAGQLTTYEVLAHGSVGLIIVLDGQSQSHITSIPRDPQ
jgi:transcriptional/translational regulatory protein YebC/TACO1